MPSSISRHEVVRWFTTPKELRRIADEMDDLWGSIRPGQDKTVSMVYSKDTELHILIDQDRMSR